MVAGGLFNAVAFAGAGYLFQKFNKDGYGEETRRHDLALEKLERARQEWNQKDIERQEKMAASRRERSDADADFKNINKALKDYERVTTLVFDGKKFTRQPHISDFYEPSSEMKEYMTLAIGTMGLVGGCFIIIIIKNLILQRLSFNTPRLLISKEPFTLH